jgi:hypothetical protein
MKSILSIIIFMIPGILASQPVLDEYIKSGLENNLALQQKQAGYEKSLQALKEARDYSIPTFHLMPGTQFPKEAAS